MLPLQFIDRVKYLVERQFVKGALFQLLVVAIFIGLISLVGGLLVWPGENSFSSLGDAIWWAFLRLTDPGYLGDDEGGWRRLVSTILTVSGYVVFMGTLVAILTRSLIARMTDLERGLTPVTLRHHVVVLGWTSRTVPILQELTASTGRVKRFLQRHAVRRLRLVVLSEEVSSAQLLSLRNERDIGSHAGKIVLRSGTPLQPDALHRVACLDAAAVIIPSSSHGPDSLVTSDVETVKALLSMASQAQYLRRELPYIVAEIEDIRKQALVERAYPGPLEVVSGDAIVSRLLVQTLLHPGLTEICNELLTARYGNDIFVRSGDIAEGQTLEQLASRCPDAIVMGVLHPLGEQGDRWDVQLNASSDTRISARDRVILMARDYDDTEPAPEAGKHAVRMPAIARSSTPALPVNHAGPRHRILLLGWNRRVPALLSEMGLYDAHEFDVDVVSIVAAETREAEISRYLASGTSVRARQIVADFIVEDDLRRLRPESYDSILFLSSDRLASGEEADARTMMGYLQLGEVLASQPSARERSTDEPQIIMELSDPDNETLLVTNRSETVVSPMVLSHILAQVALRRELKAVLDELFTPGGAEIMLRPQSDFDLPVNADFAALEKAVAACGETALGIFRSTPDTDGHWVQLNPPRSTLMALEPGDQLVVLSRV